MITPHRKPSVRPAMKIISVINSTFGTIKRAYPRPIANAENIAARTNSVSWELGIGYCLPVRLSAEGT